MTPRKPYLLRALYEWISDNQLTPYLLVDATLPGMNIPTQYVRDGKIIFNLSSSAVKALHIDAHAVSFDARFSGVAMAVYIPIAGALAIYAKENGQGLSFQEEPDSSPPPAPEPPPPKPRSHLKIVK
jgi:stringent starvation protein B